MMEFHDVHASYDAVVALHGISFEVKKGEIVCLLGANGAGKSTTLRLISGLIHPKKGEISFNGQNIHNMSPESIVKLGISHVPEGRRVFPGLSVTDNLVLGVSNRTNVSKQELKKDINEIFNLFPDLKRLQNALGWTLSGGQQQMLAIARGLMAKPKVLLMDEPSLGLAPIVVQEVFRTIEHINKNMGTTVLLVEQNASMALAISDRGYVMETGEIVFQGMAKELLNNPEVQSAYLGGRVKGGCNNEFS
ncbi:MAG TPA: ABC transporter ATP-binding protein [Bacillota bacterium]|nr:ABC transporter ATP-binding protein [Bacillota bacterium]HPL53035.1 ABC transporter ATP-binding protein [Bacillota bacterium]